jgi:hypothetical protein
MITRQKPLNINTKIMISKNPLGIKPNTMVDLNIEIIDQYAFIKTSIPAFTKDLSKTSNPGEQAKYIESTKTLVVKYKGKTQKEIALKLGNEIAKLPRGVLE